MYKTGRSKLATGYILCTGHYDHPNSRSKGQVLEHVLVMTEHLGRPLVPGENVHHKNGIKDDNRIENLELWYKSQPGGQRTEDLVRYLESIGYEITYPHSSR